MNRKYKENSLDILETSEKLQKKFSISPVLAKILAIRGVKSTSDAKFFLESDIVFSHNPFLFKDMTALCDRILAAIEDNEKIRIFGDRDADGITSTVLFYKELSRMGANVSYYIPSGEDQYGLTCETIDKALEDGITLGITVDCGISCENEVKYASQHKMDFIITDHHIGSAPIEDAVAVIDPKSFDSTYPFKDLAGCGVAAKCIWALRFAQTPLYMQSVILLHCNPGNSSDTIIIEAVKLENLCETKRVCEEVVPGILPAENSNLMKFLTENGNMEIFVLDSATETVSLCKAFPKAEICLTDLRPEFEKALPYTKKRSLFELRNMSRAAKYSATDSELDVLISLFNSYVRSVYPALHNDFKPILDLVAIGTISDIMSMKDENRLLVKTGLKELEKGSRPSLSSLLAVEHLSGRKLSSTDISWNITPLINAAGRLGKSIVPFNMLISENSSKTFEYINELESLNNERKKIGETFWEKIEKEARNSYEELGTKMVLVRREDIPRGITGLLCSRLLKQKKAPSMVITKTGDGKWTGSIRSNPGFNCHDFLEKFNDLLEAYGGHACAGGFTVKEDKINELEFRISEALDYMDCPQEEEKLEIDIVLGKNELSPSLLEILEILEPYGEQNPPVVFEIKNALIENLKVLPNSSHVKFTIMTDSSEIKWPCIFWSAGPMVGKVFNENERANIVFRMGKNYYLGQENVQLTVLDVYR